MRILRVGQPVAAGVVVLAVAGCRPAPEPARTVGPATQSPDPNNQRAVSPPDGGPQSPRSGTQSVQWDLPPGWEINCRAFVVAVAYLGHRKDLSDGGYFDRTTDLDTWPQDQEELPFEPEHEYTNIVLPCELDGDFDRDGTPDRATWVSEQGSFAFDIAVAWGHGATTLVGGGGGHIDAFPGSPGCNASMWSVAGAFVQPGDLRVHVGATNPLEASDSIFFGEESAEPRLLLRYEDEGWTYERLDMTATSTIGGAAGLRMVPREQAPATTPAECRRAINKRKDHLRKLGSEYAYPFGKRPRVDATCSYQGDLDGDGHPDTVGWTTVGDAVGLRIDTGAGETTVVHSFTPGWVAPKPGEPGCTQAFDLLAQASSVAVARWNGSTWDLPGGGQYTPKQPEGIRGDALAITGFDGHTDLWFWGDQNWQLVSLPYPWSTLAVHFPAFGSWYIPPNPVPSERPYVRPYPRGRRMVDPADPQYGPPRKRFYLGLTPSAARPRSVRLFMPPDDPEGRPLSP